VPWTRGATRYGVVDTPSYLVETNVKRRSLLGTSTLERVTSKITKVLHSNNRLIQRGAKMKSLNKDKYRKILKSVDRSTLGSADERSKLVLEEHKKWDEARKAANSSKLG